VNVKEWVLTLLRMLGSHNYLHFRIEEKISFILICNKPCFRHVSMGQIAGQVGGLLLLLLLFCGSVQAVKEGAEGPNTGFTGHAVLYLLAV